VVAVSFKRKPSSTAGSSASCWALLKRWISSSSLLGAAPEAACLRYSGEFIVAYMYVTPSCPRTRFQTSGRGSRGRADACLRSTGQVPCAPTPDAKCAKRSSRASDASPHYGRQNGGYVGDAQISPPLAMASTTWVVICSVVAASLLAILARWRRTGQRADARSQTLAEPPARLGSTFLELGNIEALAQQVNWLLSERERWVYRRVEQIEFLDRHMVRRRISIDFEVPCNPVSVAIKPQPTTSGEERDQAELVARNYVPISVLRNWPPVLNFDLYADGGKPLPLLSKSATNDLDVKVLAALLGSAIGDDIASDLMGDAGNSLQALIGRVVHGEGAMARRALAAMREALQDHLAVDLNDAPDGYERFIDVAALLCEKHFALGRCDDRKGRRPQDREARLRSARSVPPFGRSSICEHPQPAGASR